MSSTERRRSSSIDSTPCARIRRVMLAFSTYSDVGFQATSATPRFYVSTTSGFAAACQSVGLRPPLVLRTLSRRENAPSWPAGRFRVTEDLPCYEKKMGVRPSSVDSQHPASCRMCPYIGFLAKYLYTLFTCN